MADDLRPPGSTGINISLDSLRPDRFAELTRRDELPAVLDGIGAAVAAGFEPVKVNVVVVRGVNDDEIVDFARFGRDEGVTVRFIEFMPLDAEQRWTTARWCPSAEIVAAIDAVFPLERRAARVRPGRAPPLPRRRRRVGVIGTRHRAVLRQLRPGPPHRRRPAPGLPVRHRRDRPAGHPPRRRHRRRPRRRARHHGRPASGPATASARSTFIRPTRSMSEIGG